MLFLLRPDLDPDFPPSHSRTMDADLESRGGRGGRSGGVPNYKNDILIGIVERHLPRGLEAWREVALEYQREANEPTLRRGEDLRDNWNRKLCNRMQKPTGKPGAKTDRIFRCIAIERRIQDAANAAILGIDSAESRHSRDDGSNVSSIVSEVDAAAGGGGDSRGAAVGGSPVEFVQFNNGGEDEEIAAANSRTNVVDDAGRPRPQSVPAAFGSRGSATAAVPSFSSASRGPPRRSPSSMSTTASGAGGGGGGQKSKNSTNRERGSISKAMDRMAQSLESGGGGGGESSMMISMLSNQMQQAAQNMSLQQSMFQQQMQMQMAAIDKRAETSEKYLRQIAKSLAKKKKRKKGESDEEDDTSDDDD